MIMSFDATLDYYYCTDGSMTLIDTTCSKTVSTTATPVYSCPTGYNVVGNQCISQSTLVDSANFTCDLGSLESYTKGDGLNWGAM